MGDCALEWLLDRLPELKRGNYPKGKFWDRITLLTNWLWMDDRFDTRLDGLLGAVLMAWRHCGRVPVTLIVNRVTERLGKMSEEWGIRLIVKQEFKGGGGNSRDLNRNIMVGNLPAHTLLGVSAARNRDAGVGQCRAGHVGNGAFTLRSRNLCDRVAYYYRRHFRFFPHCYLFNDDYFIGKTLPSWERNFLKEVKIAPPEIAARFALENNRSLQDQFGELPFGFHGPEAFLYLMDKKLVKEPL